MERLRFVDCHSHVVPAGDDGAQSVDEGVALCREAACHWTGVLFATPHVWPHLPLTHEREQVIRAAFGEVRLRAGLDLRLGFELTPTETLLDEDPARYRLSGTECVLVETPFTGGHEPLVALAEHVERAGQRPVVAHPERAEAVLAVPRIATSLALRGWALQVNSTSLAGRHGPAVRALAWNLVETGAASIVASDGHRAARPARLDWAFEAVHARVGERATALFDGSALGFVENPSERAELSP